MDRLDRIKEFINSQIESLNFSIDSIDYKTEMLIDLIINNRDKSIVFTGVGKAGLIARVFASSMTSLGLRSNYIYPNELMHGELGQINTGDLIIFVSKSGESEELINIVGHLKQLGSDIVLLTTNKEGGMSKVVDLTITIKITNEHLLDGLSPSTSNIAFLTYFYSILSVLIIETNFTKDEFSKLHPSGLIGKKLNMNISDLIHKDKTDFLVEVSDFAEVLIKLSSSKVGGVAVLDEKHKVIGVITDGDVRRFLINGSVIDLHSIIVNKLMNTNFVSAMIDEKSFDVYIKMKKRNVSFVPVLDHNGLFLFSLSLEELSEEGFYD
jgi:arabinose-5-phosphate isomerase